MAYLEQHFAPLVSAATSTRVGTGAAAVFLTTDAELVEPIQQLRPADVRSGPTCVST